MADTLVCNVRRHRERLGWSQQTLGARIGVSRQAINAIEAGRTVPSTQVSLRLARQLGCTVEDLFTLVPAAGLSARLASTVTPGGVAMSRAGVGRVVLGRVEGRWVAHRIPTDARHAADGLIRAEPQDGVVLVEPFTELTALERTVLVAGCAPLLGALAHRVGTRFHDARVQWLAASSHRALRMLRDGLVHVAGLHLHDPASTEANRAAVQAMFPHQRMLLVNLTSWRQGFVVSAGNPLSVRTAADLLRPGVRFAGREPGAGASRLVRRLLSTAGSAAEPVGPIARGHVELARMVRYGAADVGVAIEGVALAEGLDFVPLSEERFDLVVCAAMIAQPPVSRLLTALQAPTFRAEVRELPGYHDDLIGQVTTLGAA